MNNNKKKKLAALLTAQAVVMVSTGSTSAIAETGLFPDQVYLSTTFDTKVNDQSVKLMEQLADSVALASNEPTNSIMPVPESDEADEQNPDDSDANTTFAEAPASEIQELETEDSSTLESDNEVSESLEPAKQGFFKRVGGSFSNFFKRKDQPEEVTEDIAVDEAIEIEEVDEIKDVVADVDEMTDEIASDDADTTMEAVADEAESIGEEKPGFFKRVGSSFSKMFNREKSTETGDEAMDSEVEIAESEVGLESEVEVIVEETYDLVAAPVSSQEAEVEVAVEAVEEAGEILVSETAQMTETAEKKPGILSRMGTSVSNVFTFGDKKKSSAMINGENVDLATQSLGAESDMFISANDGSVSISTSRNTMPLRDFVKLVAIKNDRIAYQKMEWAIAKSGVDSVSGIYEPELTASYQYTDSDTPNTTEEEFRRSFAPTFIERNHDYSLAVESVVPTGGRVRASYTYRDIENNIQPTPIRGEEEKNYVGLSVTQPLLRGAGWRGVESPLQVARKDQGIAKETFRQSLFQTISDAVSVYWDVYLAEKRKELRARSVEIAEGVLVDEKERARFGRSGQANVLDAESALAQRRVQMLAAEQGLFAVTGQLRNYIAGMPQDRKIKVDVSTMTEPGSMMFDRSSMLKNAYLYRPEYVAGLLRAQREDVRIQFAKNNKLPQLDLVASYGLNGLADNFGNSWDDVWDGEHESVYVGVEYRMALLGNKRGKGELSAARLRKHQALLEIKAAEIAIHNSIDTALNNLESAKMQVAELTGVVDTNKKLLDFELAKFEAGQSNSRDLFEIEERLNRVLELELESRVNLQKALIGAALSEGTLLQNFELER